MHKPKKAYTNAVNHDIYQLCYTVTKVVMPINCQVLLQEFNKTYSLFKRINETKVAVASYGTIIMGDIILTGTGTHAVDSS
jgi:hypothetical protein